MNVLVINCGSSSIKYKFFAMPEGKVLASGSVEKVGESESKSKQKSAAGEIAIEEPISDHSAGLAVIRRMLTDPEKGAIRDVSEIDACGHRVVHGAERYSDSVLIDEGVLEGIRACNDLAPLHNPPNLTGIRAAMELSPGLPQVACFDTAFHQTLPEKAFLYALPHEIYEKYRVRRYGFHGTSHRYVAKQAAEMLGVAPEKADLITCHLGNGCSMAAIKGGHSVDTSMGLTPLEGLVMGTRSGDIDPAIIFYLARKGFSVDDLDAMMNRKSGVLGLSEISNDIRTLCEQADGGNKKADLALDIFAYRVKKYIGSYLAVLNGCQAVVLTGGIGENSTAMRERILSGLDQIGLEFDAEKNRAMVGRGGAISKESSPIKILVVPTDEEVAIARDTYKLVSKDA